MVRLIALLLCAASSASAQDYWSPRPRCECRTYFVPVANYYRVTRDPWSGHVYSREYIGTRHEQRTYCDPRGRYGFEPWIQPMQPRHQWHDLDRWSTDTGYGEYR